MATHKKYSNQSICRYAWYSELVWQKNNKNKHNSNNNNTKNGTGHKLYVWCSQYHRMVIIVMDVAFKHTHL
jgi:hypothetical protein